MSQFKRMRRKSQIGTVYNVLTQAKEPFIRSIVAYRYSLVGIAYDTVSLFLLDIFRHIEKYPDEEDAVTIKPVEEEGG
jgi:hypothetical protein